MEKIKNIIALLDGVITDVLPAYDALRRWPDIDAETADAVAQAWHDLSHYASDEDIREKDREYAEHQKSMLQRHVDELRSKYSIPI